MTTPEQLAKWREDWELQFPQWADGVGILSAASWQGYLRAKQETEQAIKDARKHALEDVIQCINSERGGSSDNLILAIERLLND